LNNKEKILQFAASEMSRLGFNAVSMDMIVEKTGIAKSNAYYHYQNKEDLGIDVLNFWAGIWREFCEVTISNKSLEFDMKFEQFFDRIILYQTKAHFPGPPLLQIAGEMQNARAKEIYQETYRFYYTSCANFILLGQQKGVIKRNLNAELASSLLLNEIGGALMESRISQNAAPIIKAKHIIKSLIYA
jgi:TetR/AcrR family transcriptional repressor of nem operon